MIASRRGATWMPTRSAGQAGPLELGGEEPGEGRLRDAAVRRRELLAADLDEQVRHRPRPRPTSRWAAATACVSRRIRRMYAARSVTAIARRESSRLKACEHLSTWS